MRLIVAIVAASVLVVSTAVSAADTQFMQGLGNTDYRKIDSEVIGRSYHVFIMLPDAYDQAPEAAYPTIYVLDGGSLFPLLAAYYRYLNFGGEIPDSIIVGISYGSDAFEDGNYRSTDYTAASPERDYWGGADKFQAFLSDELFPMIERTYRSRPDRRIVFGQSIGGQFVLYTAKTKPDLFWGHIASNPALHRNLSFFLQKPQKPTKTGERSRLFVASGSGDDPVYREPAVEWMKHWSNNNDHPWQLKTMTLGGHSHMSAPPASFRQGMIWLFSND